MLGFYLSEHPAAEVKKAAGGNFIRLSSIDTIPDRAYVKMVGLITDIKRIRTKKGESMAFVTIQDETGKFPVRYSRNNIRFQISSAY